MCTHVVMLTELPMAPTYTTATILTGRWAVPGALVLEAEVGTHCKLHTLHDRVREWIRSKK